MKGKDQGVFEFIVIAALIYVAAVVAVQLFQTTWKNAPAAAAVVAEMIPNEHAITNHGVMASTAADCFNGGGAILVTRKNPWSGRKASICEMLGKYFILIQEKDGQTVTMFAKDKMSRMEQVMQYLFNAGYINP